MDIKLKSYGSIFLHGLIYILIIQPIFSLVEQPVPHCVSSTHCGQSKPVHEITIVGGESVTRGAWPWAALLGYSTNNSSIRFRCGATLLSSKTVITVGHCVYGDLTDALKVVRLGAYHLDPVNDIPKPVDYSIQKKFIHPDFDFKSNTNDIALLILTQEVHFTDFIMPICLPLSDELLHRESYNTSPVVVGWGAITMDGSMNDVILQITVPFVDNDECKRDYSVFNNTVVDERVLCTGYPQGGKDACTGDSGGPLMILDNDSYYLIGITSKGYNCGKPGFPGIYTRVTYFHEFITTHFE